MTRYRSVSALFITAGLVQMCSGAALAAPRSRAKLDAELERRVVSAPASQTTSIIVRISRGGQLPSEFRRYARRAGLGILNGYVLDVPNTVLDTIAADPAIERVSHNRPVFAHNFRTSVTSGAFFARQLLGLTGAGVGVAVIDSGIATFHDDFTARSGSPQIYPYGDQRVTYFKDF